MDLDCKSGKNLRDIKSELLLFTSRTQIPRNSSSVVLGHCLGLLVQFWRPYPVFAGLHPVVGDLYLSRLRKQKRGTDRSQPVLKQSQVVLRWLGGQLLTQLSALRGAASPGLTPGASLPGCHIACSQGPQILNTELESLGTVIYIGGRRWEPQFEGWKERQEAGRAVLNYVAFTFKHGVMYQISLELLWEVPCLAL